MIFIGLIWIPIAVLVWRMIVSKQQWPVRAGAGAAAMLTLVGSFTAPVGNTFQVDGTREWTSLALCSLGPLYLLLWSLKHRGRGRSKTISLLAAILGLVPIIATVGITLASAE